MQIFPLTKQLSLPPNFTFHSMNSPTARRPKFKPIEIVRGSSLSSVVGSPSRFIKLLIDKSSSNDVEKDHSSNIHLSTEFLYRSTSIVSHRRSNTVPSRYQKSNSRKRSIRKTSYLTPTYEPKVNIEHQLSSQPFSPSLLPAQQGRHIRAIDDPDEVESPRSSIINRNL
ncbi:unnamed protein product [Rotaria socialis]|nr:unnamed protein product [Rotaria socialis]